MDYRVQGNRPYWVLIALWGLPNRALAWACFWLSVAITVACVAFGFVDRRFFVGVIMAGAALWYYLAIRWVDRRGRWK